MVQLPNIPPPATKHEGEVDPEFAPLIDQVNKDFAGLWELPLDEFKAAWLASPVSLRPDVPSLDEIDVQIQHAPVSDGTQVEIQVYSPKGAAEEVLPLLYVTHGGGWVIGGHSIEESVNRSVCVKNRVRVVSVLYRMYV